MIEETLINYGGLGILSFILIGYNKFLINRQMEREKILSDVVTNNTKALGQISELIRKCSK